MYEHDCQNEKIIFKKNTKKIFKNYRWKSDFPNYTLKIISNYDCKLLRKYIWVRDSIAITHFFRKFANKRIMKKRESRDIKIVLLKREEKSIEMN